tara:strand:+ start:440 stop:1354 length:915 start_codon:yes stop_codon:yes gene_type:complete
MGQSPQKTLDKKYQKPENSDQADSKASCPEKPPFTPQGVASFSQTKWSRLILWQTGIALLVTLSVLLLLSQQWAPILNESIEKLPDEGGLNHGILAWPENQTGELAGNQFLEIVVNPNNQHHDKNADLQIEFQEDRWVLRSIFGFVELPYSQEKFLLDRTTQIPWWGSRRPFVFLGISCIVGLIYIIASLLLGLLGIWPLKTIVFFANRKNNFSALWRMATAAWLPAGIFLGVGSLCYALEIMVLLKLLILTLFCLLIGIFYLFLAVFYLPHTPSSIENPFYEVESKDCLSQKDNTLDSGNSSD